ncbi:MAG: HEAT repeat domain-containing protein [Deltaproteobacteria bacterium]|nr:HEAT repeat domain-containing protein [Deltaproteobacteria bacterium]
MDATYETAVAQLVARAAANPAFLAAIGRVMHHGAPADSGGDPQAHAFAQLCDGRIWDSQRVAADALAKLGSPALELLAVGLDSSHPNVRHIATSTLAAAGDPRCVPNLLSWCRNGTWAARGVALLEQVLRGAAGAVGAADLLACATLDGAVQQSYGPPDWAGDEPLVSQTPVCCGAVRAIAQAELARRASAVDE